EGRVACANLDRHEVVRERGTERGDHPQEHVETVGRDELVVLVRLEEGVRRDGELKAEGEGEEPRRDEEVEGSEQVENPDILVVRREKPPFQGFPIDHGLLLSACCTIRGNCLRCGRGGPRRLGSGGFRTAGSTEVHRDIVAWCPE